MNSVRGRGSDCVDRVGLLVGYPNLAAARPEGGRNYSWPFNRVEGRIGRKQGRDLGGSSIAVNPKDRALIARDDHVKAKCANMVERDPVVVRCGAPRECCKQRGNTRRDLEDHSAFCSKNVTWREPGCGG